MALCRMLCAFTLTALLVGAFSARAANLPDNLEPIPEPPPIPEQVRSGETLEPEVTIIQRDDEFIREYRVNGVLRAIRVEPAVGVPYFLIDVDGDGKLDRRVRRLEPDFMIPHWVLFSW